MPTKKASTAKKKVAKPATRTKSADAKKTTKTTVKKPAKKVKTTARKVAARAPTAAAPSTNGPRRVIFIDVENTNSEQALFSVLEALGIDRTTRSTELIAVGNWRAIGQQLGRQLGSLGAQLVHSAPARGVRDWSDLWIAVAAGCWLGQSKPGDTLEIVSNDRAFDAAADAAAARGVIFRRVQHRRDLATPKEAAVADETAAPRRTGRTRGGRRRRRGRQETPTQHTAQQATPAATKPVATKPAATKAAAARPVAARPAPSQATLEPHAASRDQVLDVIERLTNGQSGRWVNLDVLENALKNDGFARPAGSPRLVTRLRALKDVEIDSHGRVRLVTTSDAP